MTREEIFGQIDKERIRQNNKWNRGSAEWDRPNILKLTVLAEEFGEVARAILEAKPDDLEEELVQVAAVVVAWLESIDQTGTEAKWKLP